MPSQTLLQHRLTTLRELDGQTEMMFLNITKSQYLHFVLHPSSLAQMVWTSHFPKVKYLVIQDNVALAKEYLMLALLRRKFDRLTLELFTLVYYAFLRPFWKCVHFWFPLYRTEINKMQKVANRSIPRFRQIAYHEWLRRLELFFVWWRRKRLDFVKTFNMAGGITAVDAWEICSCRQANHLHVYTSRSPNQESASL